MDGLDPLWVVLAGFAAGAINAVIGSGTLITFPALLGIGLSPVTANCTNTVGLVPGSFAAVWSLRGGLKGHGRRTAVLASCSVTGALAGAALLLSLPEDAFSAVVPVLIAAALALILVQPRLTAAVQRRREEGRSTFREAGPLTLATLLAAGVYGGYFGAGQGIVLFAVLATVIPADLPRVNATRNLLAGLANGTGAVVFLLTGEVDLLVALLLAVSSATGGTLGAGITKRLSPTALRAVIVAVGVAAILQLVL